MWIVEQPETNSFILQSCIHGYFQHVLFQADPVAKAGNTGLGQYTNKVSLHQHLKMQTDHK